LRPSFSPKWRWSQGRKKQTTQKKQKQQKQRTPYRKNVGRKCRKEVVGRTVRKYASPGPHPHSNAVGRFNFFQGSPIRPMASAAQQKIRKKRFLFFPILYSLDCFCSLVQPLSTVEGLLIEAGQKLIVRFIDGNERPQEYSLAHFCCFSIAAVEGLRHSGSELGVVGHNLSRGHYFSKGRDAKGDSLVRAGRRGMRQLNKLRYCVGIRLLFRVGGRPLGSILFTKTGRTAKTHCGKQKNEEGKCRKSEELFSNIPSCISHPFKKQNRTFQFF